MSRTNRDTELERWEQRDRLRFAQTGTFLLGGMLFLSQLAPPDKVAEESYAFDFTRDGKCLENSVYTTEKGATIDVQSFINNNDLLLTITPEQHEGRLQLIYKWSANKLADQYEAANPHAVSIV